MKRIATAASNGVIVEMTDKEWSALEQLQAALDERGGSFMMPRNDELLGMERAIRAVEFFSGMVWAFGLRAQLFEKQQEPDTTSCPVDGVRQCPGCVRYLPLDRFRRKGEDCSVCHSCHADELNSGKR